MAAETSKSSHKKKQETAEITFKCRRCEMEKPISEMKIVTRFRPVMVVCQNCDKELR
jgi:transcription elongation factor Elf1